VSASQQELIDIMGLVKAKNISQAKAEEMFREWKTKHEGRHAKSFREKQVTTSEICCRFSFTCSCQSAGS